MLSPARWLPCAVCGAWRGKEALCAGCGALSGAERVPLDQTPGDGGRWIRTWRGPRSRVLGAMAGAARDAVPAGARDGPARIAGARHLAAALPGDALTVVVDLRPADSAGVATVRRRGNAQDRYATLPWLLVRSATAEAWVVRRSHERVRRAFSRGRMVSQEQAAELDELLVELPDGRRRRPLAGPERLGQIDLHALDPDAPPPTPLPPTAPGASLAAAASLLVGIAAAVLLLVFCPLALAGLERALRRPAGAEPSLARLAALREGPAPDAVDVLRSGPSAGDAATVRAALGQPVAWARRNGIYASGALPPAERLRWLVRAVERDPSLDVRAAALARLGEEGELGAAYLAAVAEAPQTPLPRRLQAIRLLVRRDDWRVEPLALHGLTRLDEAPALQMAWLRALVGRRGEAAQTVARRLLRDPAAPSPLQAQAAWNLLRAGAPPRGDVLLGALGRALKAAALSRTPALAHAQSTLIGAVLETGAADAETLGQVRVHPGLLPPARARLDRALDGP